MLLDGSVLKTLSLVFLSHRMYYYIGFNQVNTLGKLKNESENRYFYL